MTEIILQIENQTISACIADKKLPHQYDNILCILKDIAFFDSNAIQVNQINQKIHIKVNMPLRIIADKEVNVPIVFGTLGGALKTIFKQKVVLQCRHFMQDVSFQECIFEDSLSIMGCNFHKDALFDNAKINGFFVGSKSVFHKQASFWNVDFKEIPNFSGVGFTESNLVNFVNAKVDNSFEKLSQLAKNETKGKDNDTSNQIRNDIRDSYRT
ncbi:pentapeptide repeat-containing protein [uncultured Helicobacter sp.]|uniref:pentapeptide repeat-containing protein n=1 Tax=uncultured Helicobacter sp. TaxID=175537 RepID=UPI0026068341|nr:pentapeptide repeat-containing protein [uncultured Helicobacter sp.]